MRKTDGMRQLGDAVELVAMLEQLIDGLSRKDPGNESIPWRGMRLTLSQVKTMLARASEALSQDVILDDALIQESASGRLQKFIPSPLAGRIQKAPAGRIREIVEADAVPPARSFDAPRRQEVDDMPAAVGEE